VQAFLKATEIRDELDALINEFGDGDGQIPDPLENWWYGITRIEREPGTNAYRFVSDPQ
jgi:hypothetical protein